MRDNDGCGCFLYTLGALIGLAIVIFFTIAVINSDLPVWLKYLILR